MAAMKPRTGDGPLEVTKEGRGIVMRVPLEGGGRLVVELTADEAARLGDALKTVVPQGPAQGCPRGGPLSGPLVAPLDRREQPVAEGQQYGNEPFVQPYVAREVE